MDLDEEPCARCGIRIPRYELRMLESRLFCIYCYQELLDERRPRCVRCNETLYDPGHSTNEGFMCFPCYEKFGKEQPEVPQIGRSICDSCGRYASDLYPLGSHHYCADCYAQEKLDEPSQQGGGIRYAVAEIIKRIIGHKKTSPLKPERIPSGIKKESEPSKVIEKPELKLKDRAAVIERIQKIKEQLENKELHDEKKRQSILKLLKIRRIIPLKKPEAAKKPSKTKKAQKKPKKKKR